MSAVCCRSLWSACRRCARSGARSEPLAASNAPPAASSARCQWALIVCSSSGYRDGAADLRLGSLRTTKRLARHDGASARCWRTWRREGASGDDHLVFRIHLPCEAHQQLLAGVLRADYRPARSSRTRAHIDRPGKATSLTGAREVAVRDQTCAGTRESTRWVSSTSRFEYPTRCRTTRRPSAASRPRRSSAARRRSTSTAT